MENRYNEGLGESWVQGGGYNQSTQFIRQSYECLRESYKVLEQKYHHLMISYNESQTQMQYLSSQTENRLKILDKQTSNIINERNYQIDQLRFRVKEMENENFELKLQKDKCVKESIRLKMQLSQLENDIREQNYNIDKKIKNIQQSKIVLEKANLTYKQQIDILRKNLNQEQITSSQRLDEIRQRTNQTSIIQNINQQLQTQLQQYIKREKNNKEINEILKQEVIDLKNMFYKVEGNIKDCQQCWNKKVQNQRLKQEIFSLSKQLQLVSQIKSKNNIYTNQLHQGFSTNYKQPLRETMNNNGYKYEQLSSDNKQNMKQSVLSRCKAIIDS